MTEYGYQDEGVAYLRSHPRSMLADDPGLGKSRQALLAAEGRTLVVAPATLHAAGVWEGEREKWRPDLDCTYVSYDSVARRQKTGNGNGTKPLPVPRPEYASGFDTVIVDESHHVTGRTATRTKALGKVLRKAERVHLLTGTPIPSWAHELFIPCQWLHTPGDKRWSSYWRWVAEWFDVDTHPAFGFVQVGGLRDDRTWEQFQAENLSDMFLRRERDDVLTDLPPLVEQHFDVKMSGGQARAYRELKKDFVTWLDSGTEVAAWSTAAQVTKLVRCTTGLGLFDPAHPLVGSAKLDLLRELLAERTHSHTLVFCHFRGTAALVQALCDDMGISCATVTGADSSRQRGEVVRRLQRGDVSVLAGTLATLSEGLTLTRADGAIFVEHSWLPRHNTQALRRIHRIGQDRPVWAAHLWTSNSLDGRMRSLLETKTDQQMKALPVARLKDLA